MFEYLAYKMGVARGTLIKRLKQEMRKKEVRIGIRHTLANYFHFRILSLQQISSISRKVTFSCHCGYSPIEVLTSQLLTWPCLNKLCCLKEKSEQELNQ